MKKIILLNFALLICVLSNAQWAVQGLGITQPSRGVSNIKIIDRNTAWVELAELTQAGNRLKQFSKTIDGGVTWKYGTINISRPTYIVSNLFPVSATTAWVTANDPAGNSGGIWKTTDGGATWVAQNTAGYKSADSFINGVHFFDANNGISYGDPVSGIFEVYKTSNGGTTWTIVSGFSLPGALSGELGYIKDISAGNSFWFITNKGKIYRTNDKGSTWTKLNTPASDLTQRGVIIAFSDNNNGIIYQETYSQEGITQTIYKTNNGGTTWSTGQRVDVKYTSDFSYIPGTTTLVGVETLFTSPNTAASEVGFSNDNGITWTKIDAVAGPGKLVLSFFDRNTGWAGGINTSVSNGIFKYTGPSIGGTSLSIADFNSTSEFSVSPNPTSGNIKLYSTKNAVSNVTLYDMLGKEVHNNKFNNLSNEVNVDLSTIDTGVYFMKATAENGGVQTIKIVKN
jgi:photosystem II stability/assembly factor-like uncharacterized protein